MGLLNIHKIISSLYFILFPFRGWNTALKIFCVMIPSLVDTYLHFGLLRVVKPFHHGLTTLNASPIETHV